jgi:hypothetical protein
MTFCPDRPIDEVLLHVGEAGDRLALDEVRAVGELHVDQRRDAVAEECGRLLGLVEGGDRPLQVLVLPKLEHRRVSATDDERVELVQLEVGKPGRVLEQHDQLGRVQEAHRDQIVCRPLGRVARVGKRVDLDLAALRAGDCHVVANRLNS